MHYDPGLRRNTPLALKLKGLIRDRGPMKLADYMTHCLHDREYGYYVRQPAIGQGGDFITAPEISQVFGELIGLWCAAVWQEIGRPNAVHLVEIGPGRGTMMKDMLRAISRVPEFATAVRVKLAEPSPRLRDAQTETLQRSSIPVAHIDPGTALEGATIVVANEVLDCIPIDQLICEPGPTGDAWHVRTVELDANEELQFGIGRAVEPPEHVTNTRRGDIIEGNRTRLKFESMNREMGKPLAALFIDYGHTGSPIGDTLQAVRNHAFEHPLTSPGEADLTAHVNFAQVAEFATARAAGFTIDGPITQAEFLGRLGIVERASRLMSANPARAAEIEAGVARLIAPNGMGTRFKVIGVRSPGLPVLPGFS